MANFIESILSVPEETEPAKQLLRARAQQMALAAFAMKAAEEKCPGFEKLAFQVVAEEREALLRVEAQS